MRGSDVTECCQVNRPADEGVINRVRLDGHRDGNDDGRVDGC
jgi:hypothetical protein